MFELILDLIYRPHGSILSPKCLFLVKAGNLFTFGSCGVRKPIQIFHYMSLVFL